MGEEQKNLDQLCVNTIRMLAVDAIEKAKSGHPGFPMGTASLNYALWTKFLVHNPANPSWANRDRFILSAGHGSMLLYAMLHLTGYDLDLEEIKNFRQWGSKTPGHPEYGVTPGVETTTGPLGQGLANGVGLAMAERYLAAYFNRPGYDIVDYYTYVVVSDGDLMEGVSHETASLAGHLQLGKLICLYDDNRISIEGSTDISYTEDRVKRFEAYGWHVLFVEDGNDLEALRAAIKAARDETSRPSLIVVRTHIGYGSPNRQDSPQAHGEPLGEKEAALTRQNLGWPQEPSFFIPDQALARFRRAIDEGKARESAWRALFNSYSGAYPALAGDWRQWREGVMPEGWDKAIPFFPANPKGQATRIASGEVLNAIASKVPNLLGGSADLAPSNKTLINGSGNFSVANYGGRNIRFGVREHGMGAILNGLALSGGLLPYGATFLTFADYMRPPIRLAALMELKVIYIFTHDSIGLGEDGPTHQPVEQLASLRAIPGLTVIRPADANETAEAWRWVLESAKGPAALILTRQNVPTLDRGKYAPAGGVSRGAYILSEAKGKKPDVILIASGSEVHLALEASEKLKANEVAARVVNMASWELFDSQPEKYRREVLPPVISARVAIEAGITQGWHRYVGDKGVVIGLDRFGASAPHQVLYQKYRITSAEVVRKVLELI